MLYIVETDVYRYTDDVDTVDAEFADEMLIMMVLLQQMMQDWWVMIYGDDMKKHIIH